MKTNSYKTKNNINLLGQKDYTGGRILASSTLQFDSRNPILLILEHHQVWPSHFSANVIILCALYFDCYNFKIPAFIHLCSHKIKFTLYFQHFEYDRALNMGFNECWEWTRILWDVICVSSATMLVFFLNDYVTPWK